MAEVIPLFPLSHVLLPGMPLPLHIFEQRYRDLLADLADAPGSASFGVIALRTGTETISFGADGRAPDVEHIGTVAEIIENEPRPDGSSDLLAVGSRRFRVNALVPDGKSYLRAEIQYLDESDGDLTAGQEARARRLLEIYDSILLRIAGRATGSELPDDALALSYEICARVPLPPHERQTLLDDASAAARLDRVARLLHREIALLQSTRSVAISPAALRVVTSLN